MKIKHVMKRLFQLLLGLVVLGLIVLGIRNYSILKKVHQYDQSIAAAAKKYQLSDQQDLIAAIIFTESKGKGTDVMQSSESRYGEAGKISDPAESIDSGVKFLAEAIQKAEAADCDLSTAIQAYNYGLDYITYVKQHGGKNSFKLADDYSRDVLSPTLGNDDQTTYRYWGLNSFLYNGGFLYHNGGNIFYANLVKGNQQKIQWTKFLF